MQQWKKRGDYRSVAEAVQGMSGLTLEELRSPAHVEPETIENLAACGEALKQWAIQDGLPVVIVGDYDADGITSTAILVKLLRHFGVTPQTIIPRRFTGRLWHQRNADRRYLRFPDHNRRQRLPPLSPSWAAKEAGNKTSCWSPLAPRDLTPADILSISHPILEKNGPMRILRGWFGI